MQQQKLAFGNSSKTLPQLSNSATAQYQDKQINSSSASSLPTSCGVQQEKLMQLTCMCDVDKNGVIDQEIKRKDKNKVLHVYRTITKVSEDEPAVETLRFMMRFQKSLDVFCDFTLKNIQQIFNQKAADGLLTIVLSLSSTTTDENSNKSLSNSMNKGNYRANTLPGQSTMNGSQIMQLQQAKQSCWKLFLSKVEPSLIQALCKLIQEEHKRLACSKQEQDVQMQQPQQPQKLNKVQQQWQQMQQAQKQVAEEMLTKKRKVEQMTGGAVNSRQPQNMIVNNPRNKIRRLTSAEEDGGIVELKSGMLIAARKPSITLEMLPLDILWIIMNYIPGQEVFPILRGVSKQFYRLTGQRKRGLLISKPEISQKMYFSLCEKSKKYITQFSIRCRTFLHISPTIFESNMIQFPKLQELDLLRFQSSITDQALSRLLNACTKSLNSFKLGYGSNNSDKFGFGALSTVALSKCRQLKKLTLGEPDELLKPKQVEGRLNLVKKLMNHKSFSLEYLTLYQADGYIVEALSQKGEAQSLIQLCIVQYIQKRGMDEQGNPTSEIEDLVNMKKFKSLQSFNLCSTYFPLHFQVQLPDAANNQSLSVAGSREFELMIFCLKNNLKVLHLGSYIYDELLVYITEMCLQLEKLEINSDQVTDRGLTNIFVKLAQLKYIDLAACPNFTGMAVMSAEPYFAAKDLRRFVFALEGYEKQKVTEKVTQLAPHCQMELKLKKSYKLSGNEGW